MNCFEARRDFRAFWRRELSAERREAFVAHLRECQGCDGAFRNFALSAPVLHSEAEPARRREDLARPREAVVARRPAMAYRTSAPRRQWLSMSAAAMVLIAGIMAAYLSISAPVGDLNDVLSQSEPRVEPVVELFGPVTPAAPVDQGNGFAG
jgi:anti-sigma factor RsiW